MENPEESAKAKLLKKLGGVEKKPDAGTTLNLNMTGFPPLDAIIEALGGVAEVITQQSQKIETLQGAVEQLTQQNLAMLDTQKTTNDLLAAPVIPVYDGEKITSAQRKLKEKTNGNV